MNLKEAVEEIDQWLEESSWIQQGQAEKIVPNEAIKVVNGAIKTILDKIEEEKRHEEVAEELYDITMKNNSKAVAWEQLIPDQRKTFTENCKSVYGVYVMKNWFNDDFWNKHFPSEE